MTMADDATAEAVVSFTILIDPPGLEPETTSEVYEEFTFTLSPEGAVEDHRLVVENGVEICEVVENGVENHKTVVENGVKNHHQVVVENGDCVNGKNHFNGNHLDDADSESDKSDGDDADSEEDCGYEEYEVAELLRLRRKLNYRRLYTLHEEDDEEESDEGNDIHIHDDDKSRSWGCCCQVTLIATFVISYDVGNRRIVCNWWMCNRLWWRRLYRWQISAMKRM